MNKPSILVFSILLLLAACNNQNKIAKSESNRYVEGNQLISKSLPKITIKIASEFYFVGRFDFVIKAMSEEYEESLRGKPVAEGERFVFAKVDPSIPNLAQKLFIVQFEGFYENLDLTYNYDLSKENQMGDFKYRNNTWFYNNKENISQYPEAEAAKTFQLLEEKGLKTKDEVLMSRFVTVVDENRKNEMIIYYLEFAEDNDFSLVEFESGKYEKLFVDSLEKKLVKRSLNSFQILN